MNFWQICVNAFRVCENITCRAKREKCRFGVDEIDYLGFTINKSGIRPNRDKARRDFASADANELRAGDELSRYAAVLWSAYSEFVPEIGPAERAATGRRSLRVDYGTRFSFPTTESGLGSACSTYAVRRQITTLVYRRMLRTMAWAPSLFHSYKMDRKDRSTTHQVR